MILVRQDLREVPLAQPRFSALVLRSSALLVGTGVAAGLAISFFATRALRSMLYGVTPGDPVTLATGVLALGVVAAVATLVPARWASRTTFGELLRSE